MCLVRNLFVATVWLLIFNTGAISDPFHCVNCAIRCDQPACQSLPPTPPPPSDPIYGGQSPPPPPDPSYGVPPPSPPPSDPSYGVPPPPVGPSYGVTFSPPPFLQCCNYPPPSIYSVLPYGSASKLPLSFFPFMVLAFTFTFIL